MMINITKQQKIPKNLRKIISSSKLFEYRALFTNIDAQICSKTSQNRKHKAKTQCSTSLDVDVSYTGNVSIMNNLKVQSILIMGHIFVLL